MMIPVLIIFLKYKMKRLYANLRLINEKDMLETNSIEIVTIESSK